MSDIMTTSGETFTHEQSADLALMIYRRFGRDRDAARAAWNRMLQNNCDITQFTDLLIDAVGRLPQNAAIRHLLQL
jgi:hypothetical protein